MIIHWEIRTQRSRRSSSKIVLRLSARDTRKHTKQWGNITHISQRAESNTLHPSERCLRTKPFAGDKTNPKSSKKTRDLSEEVTKEALRVWRKAPWTSCPPQASLCALASVNGILTEIKGIYRTGSGIYITADWEGTRKRRWMQHFRRPAGSHCLAFTADPLISPIGTQPLTTPRALRDSCGGKGAAGEHQS